MADVTSRKKVAWVIALLLSIAFALLAWALPARSQTTNAAPSVLAKPGEWRYLNSDPLATRYSPLDQIDKDNFKDLRIAWRWKPASPPAVNALSPPSTGRRASNCGYGREWTKLAAT